MGQSTGGLRGNKGEDGADDVKRQVDSDDNQQKPIYQLVNVKSGGGKLIELIKASARSCTSFSKSSDGLINSAQNQLDADLDTEIKKLVEPLLYNGGRGKLVPLSKLWLARYGKLDPESCPTDEFQYEENVTDEESRKRYRWVCWRLDQRGAVGETALHICFLLSTSTHMVLARKLLSFFPMLINDIYHCDQYFGESSLHMAIVNENIKIVKLLLDHGANFHERCLGSFFIPGDQSDNANGILKKACDKAKGQGPAAEIELGQLDLMSNHFKSLKTNYDGYAYWGEYPLSFATCLGLQDCYKLLLAKGANPNRQDSNGNSSLHMAVIADRIDMFDLCYSTGAGLDVTNKQNMTPLTLAALLRRKDMFFHILTIQRQVSWIFCNVGFVEVPLKGLDSINTNNGSCDDDSVLSIVVFGGDNEHLQMFDGLVSQLLEIKWVTSVRTKFYWWLFKYILFLIISAMAYITRFYRKHEPSDISSEFRQFNLVSECVLIVFVFHYIWISITRIVAGLSWSASVKVFIQTPEMLTFLLTCLAILACIPLRLLNWQRTEDFIAALVMFTLPLKLLFFCRASRSVGSFVVMIYKIVVNDVLCFVVFLIIFVAGFSQSFHIIFKTHNPSIEDNTDKNYFANLFDGLISMHMMALNEFSMVFDEFEATDYPKLAKLLFCIYMILVSILLVNMLIAMLGKTYQDIASQPNENLRQWARALLFVERTWTNKNRLQVLDRYTQPKTISNNNTRIYGCTWTLSLKDRIQLQQLKELKKDHQKSAIRLARTDSGQ